MEFKSEHEVDDAPPMAIREVPEPPEIIWRDGVEYRRVHRPSEPEAPTRLHSSEADERQRIRLFDRQNGRCYHCNEPITERGKGVRVAVEGSDGVLICDLCGQI